MPDEDNYFGSSLFLDDDGATCNPIIPISKLKKIVKKPLACYDLNWKNIMVLMSLKTMSIINS